MNGLVQDIEPDWTLDAGARERTYLTEDGAELFMRGSRLVLDWLRANGLDPERVWRVERRVVDLPMLRVYQHAVNGQGRKFIDPQTSHAAQEPPFDVLETEPLPAPILAALRVQP